MITITIPKRPGQAEREAEKAMQKQLIEDYFEGLKIVDVDSEVVESRLLTSSDSFRFKVRTTLSKTFITL